MKHFLNPGETWFPQYRGWAGRGILARRIVEVSEDWVTYRFIDSGNTVRSPRTCTAVAFRDWISKWGARI